MKNHNQSLNNSFGDGQGKYNNKERLIAYLKSLSRFPDVLEHNKIASSFEVSNYRPIFKNDAIRRVLSTTFIEPLTAATIDKTTGVNQKYVCRLKVELEDQKRIKVICLGLCPTTASKGVQFLSSNPDMW
ncbi:hypothetical protein JQC67_07825 [Aurantibacter crassamenti]|uniref:hypothetical protein n=1 Tax=Aurantibacter crassamenti TaxID=1837375 RepID=UPI0019398F7E|nr:hypothetical protein [Aurantibacter crassamenti]MBM1106040.1 hypothetical protein [Aurantibacter crassamenti]